MYASDSRHAHRRIKPEILQVRHFVIFSEANGRTVADWYLNGTFSRKVRAPVDRLPGNSWARMARAVRDGQCHREQTAILRDGKGETVG